MIVLCVLIGGILGAAWGAFPGCLLGSAAGWLLGDALTLRRRLDVVERELARLRGAPLRESPQPREKGETAALPRPSRATPWFSGADDLAEGPESFELEPPANDASAFVPREPVQPEQESASPSGFPLPEPLRAFLSGGNLLVKTGIVILFFGVSFLVKYAAQHGLLPIELRLAASALFGFVLLGVGWRVRRDRLEYALALQGGGIGILYITVFATFRLYALLPALPAFALLVAISALCAALALLEDTPTLALFGISGGFLAPLLASTGHGSHVFLFGYYAVLNAGIIGIAWFKSWRPLNLAGFLFTFVIGAFWGARYYRPEFFATTEPFLVLFFFMYLAVAVLFALRQPPKLKGYLDGSIIFGTPVVSFALQATLVSDYRYGMAWSALAAGLIYLSLAWALRQREEALRPLAEAFAAFGAIYLTLAVPLACDGRWTAAIWGVEGAAIAWTGVRQGRRGARWSGIALQFAAGVAFAVEAGEPVGALPLLNSFYLGCLLLALSGLLSAYTLYKKGDQVDQREVPVHLFLMGWGLIWWVAGGVAELERHLDPDLLYGAEIVFISGSCTACHFLARRLSWRPLLWPALGVVVALWGVLLPSLASHPLMDGGAFGWPAALALLYLILYLNDEERPETLTALHAAALWLVAVLLTRELEWRLVHGLFDRGSWVAVSRGVFPALILLFLGRWGDTLSWPVKRHRAGYYALGAFPLLIWSYLWVLAANLLSSGDPYPLPWLPLANTLDLFVLLSLAAHFFWYRRLTELSLTLLVQVERIQVVVIYAAEIFLWLNAVLARALHYWGGVPLDPYSLFESRLAQTSFAIFWSVLSLIIMVLGNRRALRPAWLCGGALLGVVVLKLFVIDLAGQGTVERIVSFVAVGVLLLVIGWFSPVPPK